MIFSERDSFFAWYYEQYFVISWTIFFLCGNTSFQTKSAIMKWNLARGESHINFRTQCTIMTQTRWPLTPYYLRHSQYFDKIDSFLKPVLNSCILGNLIVGEVDELLKGGGRGGGGVAGIVFSCKLLTFFCKRRQFGCLTGSIRRFQKTLFMLC